MKRTPLVEVEPGEKLLLRNRRLTVLYRANAEMPKLANDGDLVVFDLHVRRVFEFIDTGKYRSWEHVSPTRVLYRDAIEASIDAMLIERNAH